MSATDYRPSREIRKMRESILGAVGDVTNGLLYGIEHMDDTSEVEKVIGERKAEATLSMLDKLHYAYAPYQTGSWGEFEYRHTQHPALKKRTDPKVTELFGLGDEATYSSMERLTKDLLDERVERIRGSRLASVPLLGMLYEKIAVYVASDSHNETLIKIRELRSGFLGQ